MTQGARTTLAGVRAVIVDLDGTMVDTAPDFLVAVNRMREELDLPPLDIQSVIRHVGKGSENLVRRVLEEDLEANQAESLLPSALDAYMRHYLAVNGQFSQVYPEVPEGLQALRELGLRLACVTNKPLSFARTLLEKTRLAVHFELIFGGDSFPHKKPHPHPLLQVARSFALEPAQVLALGDSSNDAAAARAAGMPVLIVPYGYNHGEPVHSIDSDGIVSTLRTAADLISASKRP